MITTSYFARVKKIPNPVSISSMSPAWYTGATLRMLAPPINLVKGYKNGFISESEYVLEYTLKVLDKLDPKDAYSYIIFEFGDDATLLCYEKSGDFCHRRLVADWFERSLNITVPELSFSK